MREIRQVDQVAISTIQRGSAPQKRRSSPQKRRTRRSRSSGCCEYAAHYSKFSGSHVSWVTNRREAGGPCRNDGITTRIYLTIGRLTGLQSLTCCCSVLAGRKGGGKIASSSTSNVLDIWIGSAFSCLCSATGSCRWSPIICMPASTGLHRRNSLPSSLNCGDFRR